MLKIDWKLWTEKVSWKTVVNVQHDLTTSHYANNTSHMQYEYWDVGNWLLIYIDWSSGRV